MLSFLNSTYVVCIEFLDKDGNVIKDIKKPKKEGDNNNSSSDNTPTSIEITKDIFSYTGMEIYFEMEKVPRIVLHSRCKDTDFINKIGTFVIKVDSILKYQDEKSLNKEEQISVSFPASPVTIDTKNAWETTWWCIMDTYKNIFDVEEQYFVPSSFLNDKYSFVEKEKVFTKLVFKNDKWVKVKETRKVKVPDYDVYKKYNLSLGNFYPHVTLSEALTDLTTLTFHQPSEAVLNLSKNVYTKGFPSLSKVDTLERLIEQVPLGSDNEKPRGVYFTFKKIRTLGEEITQDTKIKLIEPKGRINTKNTSSSKEVFKSIENYEIEDFISYQKDASGRVIAKDVKDGNSLMVKDVLLKKMSLENCIKYEYNTEVPSKISIGDPVLIFTSFDGSKIYGGFVTYEKLLFDHKIRGFYEISANPNFIQTSLVVTNNIESVEKNEKALSNIDLKNTPEGLKEALYKETTFEGLT